jgi:hypothetical protein
MMAYGSVTGVARINSHATGGYTAASLPTATAVAEWLEQGATAVDLALAKAGYGTPVSSAAQAYPYLVRLNNLWAAAAAESSTNQALGEAETRSDGLWQMYRDELRELLDGDLTLVGLTRSGTAPVRRRVSSLPLRRYDGFAKNADEVRASEYAQDDDE